MQDKSKLLESTTHRINTETAMLYYKVRKGAVYNERGYFRITSSALRNTKKQQLSKQVSKHHVCANMLRANGQHSLSTELDGRITVEGKA